MARAALALTEGPIVAVGHSMGARVALEMVRSRPSAIERARCSTPAFIPGGKARKADRQVLVDLAFDEGMGALADRWLPPMVHEARTGDPGLMAPTQGHGPAGDARAASSADPGASRPPGRRAVSADHRLSDPGHGRAPGSLEPARPARGDRGGDSRTPSSSSSRTAATCPPSSSPSRCRGLCSAGSGLARTAASRRPLAWES